MNKTGFWPRAAAGAAIVALVLLTNEGYRQVRTLVDTVTQSEREIAQFKRDLYVLQVQIDSGPITAATSAMSEAPVAVPTFAPSPPPVRAALLALPMPSPIGLTRAALEVPAQPRTKPQPEDENKSLMKVVLMSEAKTTTVAQASVAQAPEGPKMDVHLIGDLK